MADWALPRPDRSVVDIIRSVGLVVLGFLFARKVRETGFYTLPALIEKQYGRIPAMAGSILIVVAWMAVIAGQIIAAGTIMSVLGYGSCNPLDNNFHSCFSSVIPSWWSARRAENRPVADNHHLFRDIADWVSFYGNIGGFNALKSGLPSATFLFRSVRNLVLSN